MTASRRIAPLAAALAAFVFLAPGAMAHEPYSGKRDPVTGGGCCGGTDCAVLAVVPGMLSSETDGYRIRLTVDQARAINPYRNTPVDTLVPWNRIQASWDGQFHICIPTHTLPYSGSDFFCFWEPPNT